MAFTKITQAQLDSRGATKLPNKPTISATDLKKEFDAPAKEIVAPALNQLIDDLEDDDAAENIGFSSDDFTATNVKSAIEEANSAVSAHEEDTDNPHSVTAAQVGLDNVDNTSDEDKPVSTATQTELDKKVDKVNGKGLSTNDYDNTEKESVAANTSARHTHSNKSVLDKFTESDGKPQYDGAPIEGTKDYEALDNLPSINNVELKGSKSLSDLGIASASSVTSVNEKLSEYEDSGYLPKDGVDSLSNVQITQEILASEEWLKSRNIWNEHWEIGRINNTTGQKEVGNNDRIRNADYVPCKANTTYYGLISNANIYFYKADKTFISYVSITNGTFTTPSETSYLSFFTPQSYGTSYKNDICFNESDDKNGTYSPYSDSNVQITQRLSDEEERGFYSKNQLNPTLTTTTLNGVTCTRNADGTYKLNGTATEATSFWLFPSTTNRIANNFYGMKLVGCPSGGNSTSGYSFYTPLTNDSGWVKDIVDTGNGALIDVNTPYILPRILIRANTVCNNLVFKPMITSDTNATYNDYQKYIPSNATISDELSALGNTQSVSISVDGTVVSAYNSGSMVVKIPSIKMCFYSITVTCGSGSAWTDCILGLPKPISTIQGISNNNTNASRSGLCYSLNKTSGNIQFTSTIAGATRPTSGDSLTLSGMYIYS